MRGAFASAQLLHRSVPPFQSNSLNGFLEYSRVGAVVDVAMLPLFVVPQQVMEVASMVDLRESEDHHSVLHAWSKVSSDDLASMCKTTGAMEFTYT